MKGKFGSFVSEFHYGKRAAFHVSFIWPYNAYFNAMNEVKGMYIAIISLNISQWPSKSPNLSMLDFCIWGYLKDRVY